jgi:hypothetical protein
MSDRVRAAVIDVVNVQVKSNEARRPAAAERSVTFIPMRATLNSKLTYTTDPMSESELGTRATRSGCCNCASSDETSDVVGHQL